MIVDTDVLVWYMRGHAHARRVIESLDAFGVSAVTYMEIVQGVRNNGELRTLKQFMIAAHYRMIPGLLLSVFRPGD